MSVAPFSGSIPEQLARRSRGLGLRPLAWVLWLLPFLAGQVAAAQSTALDVSALGAPSFQSFTPRDGLPDGVVSVLGVDPDGFAWAASPQGLFRFVGHRWQRRVGPEMGRVHRRMLLDSHGTLWAPTLDAGITSYSGGRWTHATVEGGLSTNNVYRISEATFSGRSSLWMLTMGHGLFFRQGESWQADPGNESLPGGPLLSMTVTTELSGEARQWLGSGDHGLFFRRQGEVEWRRSDIAGLPEGQIEDVQRSVDAGGEALWVSIFGEGLWRLDSQGLHVWRLQEGTLRSNEVYTITVVDSPGAEATAWVASRGGLVRVRGDFAETFGRQHGLPSDQIRGTRLWQSPDGQQVLWIATENGAARTVLNAERWRTVSLMGSGGLGVFGVEVELDGRGGERLWVGSMRDGLGLYEAGTWRIFSAETGHLPDSSVRSLNRAKGLDGRDGVWAGLMHGHVVRIGDGPTFETIKTPWPKLSGQSVSDVYSRVVDGEREVWFATQFSGMYRLRKDGWTSFGSGVSDEGTRILSFIGQVDRDQRSWLWAASSLGLLRFDGSDWTLLGTELGLPERALNALTLPKDGTEVLWIGSAYDGLLRLDVSDPASPILLAEDDLPRAIDMTVYSAEHDSRGRVYICTNAGVQQLTPRPGGRWQERTFGRRDGMVHEECNTNAQLIDAHDRFWTGTLGGLTVFDPSATVQEIPKALRLVEVRADNFEIDPSAVVLEPSVRDFQVEFTLQSWQREEESLFRTQLVGVDAEPGPWTSQTFRTLAALAPGHHVLRIEAKDFAGFEAHPFELGFRMMPAWWQRRSVRGLAGLLGTLLVVGIVLTRNRNFRRQKRHLETMVSERTEALNIANDRLQTLSYTDTLTALANRRSLMRRLQEAANEDLGSDGAGVFGLIFIDVDHFKEYNDRLGHPAGDEALRVIARSLLECAKGDAMVARYGGEEFACLIPNSCLEEAEEVAESMRSHVAAQTVDVPGSNGRERVTISAGVACGELRGEPQIHHLLRDADKALYRAKGAGRNRVST